MCRGAFRVLLSTVRPMPTDCMNETAIGYQVYHGHDCVQVNVKKDT